jgi:Tfp pilus assembly protein PilZ
MLRRLQLHLPTLSAFKQELERNIVCGGALVETDEHYVLEEKVDVEIDLPFCGQSVILEARVVNRVGPDVTRAGGQGGVAVQFAEPAHAIYQLLSDMADLDTQAELAGQRKQRGGPARLYPRTPVRIPTIVEASGGRRVGHTVDMSRSGVLIEFDGAPLPIGQQIMLSFPHPESRESLQLPGRVVREDKSANRRKRAGVQFDLGPWDESPKARALDDLLRAAHARLLGQVSGEFSAIGVANLLQMFASSSKQGTLTLRQRDREARLIFVGGELSHAILGGVTGQKALARVLEWTEGDFDYTPSIDPDAPEGETMPINAALMDATQHFDELRRLDLSDLQPSAKVVSVRPPQESDELDAVTSSVLEAISNGIVIGDLLDVLTEFDDDIYRSLKALSELGVIRIGEAPPQ